MGLPFLASSTKKKRDQMLAIDLGGHMTKAVHLQRRGEGFVLCGFALVDAPIYEKSPSAELLGEHLKAVSQALEAKTKFVALAVGVNDAIVRHVEMPPMPVSDMRLALKNNSKAFLQQDLPNYVFDCFFVPPRTQNAQNKAAEAPKGPAVAQKQKMLVAGAKKQLIENFQTGAKLAGLVADQIIPGLIGPVNVFERAMPELYATGGVALVDVGFKHSSICILQQGELVLSRVVALGGDHLTAGLAEAMNISYAEAEGIKIGMAGEVMAPLGALLSPLGRELRASIDFFEHQQDKTVTHVLVTGGSTRSEFILQTLQSEMLIECKTWNPTSFLQMSLSPKQVGEIEQVAPQLTVALGTALAAL